jgi:hypothetical protein
LFAIVKFRFNRNVATVALVCAEIAPSTETFIPVTAPIVVPADTTGYEGSPAAYVNGRTVPVAASYVA